MLPFCAEKRKEFSLFRGAEEKNEYDEIDNDGKNAQPGADERIFEPSHNFKLSEKEGQQHTETAESGCEKEFRLLFVKEDADEKHPENDNGQKRISGKNRNSSNHFHADIAFPGQEKRGAAQRCEEADN